MKVDYSKGFIYKICCLDSNVKECYVGCSTDFKSRKRQHKLRCCDEKNSKHHYKVYQFIRANGGWDNWRMIILHDFPCKSKRELEQEETRVMLELGSELNAIVSFVTEERKREQMDRENEARREKIANDPEYREKKNKQNQESWEKNKDVILEKRRNDKVICEFCESEVRKDCLKRHQRTQKCLACQ